MTVLFWLGVAAASLAVCRIAPPTQRVRRAMRQAEATWRIRGE